jgi:hypothetical protein
MPIKITEGNLPLGRQGQGLEDNSKMDSKFIQHEDVVFPLTWLRTESSSELLCTWQRFFFFHKRSKFTHLITSFSRNILPHAAATNERRDRVVGTTALGYIW